MSFPKKHHFVPEVLLKRFVDSDGWLYAFSKDDPDQKVRKERPSNVFYAKHLYSAEGPDGTKDPLLEKEFSKLETAIDPVLNKLANAGLNNQLPALTDQERLLWHYFFALQFKRVPDFLHRPEFVGEAASHFREILEEFRQKYPDRRDELETIAGETRRFIKNAQVGALGSVSADVIKVLESRAITILKLTDPKKAFAIGSRPVVQLAFGSGKTLHEPSTEMWLPISNTLLVGVGETGQRESILFLNDHSAIRHLNRAVAEQSSHFASCSPELTRSLAFHR